MDRVRSLEWALAVGAFLLWQLIPHVTEAGNIRVS